MSKKAELIKRDRPIIEVWIESDYSMQWLPVDAIDFIEGTFTIVDDDGNDHDYRINNFDFRVLTTEKQQAELKEQSNQGTPTAKASESKIAIAKLLTEFIESDWDFHDESETEQAAMEYAQKIVELFEQSNPVEVPKCFDEDYKRRGYLKDNKSEILNTALGGIYRTGFQGQFKDLSEDVYKTGINWNGWSAETILWATRNYSDFCMAVITGNYTVNQEPKYQILKLHVDYFDAVAKGIKTFEIRKNDRNFQIGNVLVLREYDPIDSHTGEFTGRECRVRVTYMTDYEQKTGYVVLGIEPVKEETK